MSEMDVRSALLELHREFSKAEIAHALIGGLALAVHHAERATIDVDFLIEATRSDDADRLIVGNGFPRMHRNEHVGNYGSADPVKGRVDVLFTRSEAGRAMLERAARYAVHGVEIPVVDASDLIGLKVQSSSNDPGRSLLDVADILRLIRCAEIDHERVRGYFRLFDREPEFEALLVRAGER